MVADAFIQAGANGPKHDTMCGRCDRMMPAKRLVFNVALIPVCSNESDCRMAREARQP